LASLIYFNEEIDEEERERRWGTLNREIARRTVLWTDALVAAPRPIMWHDGADRYTAEERNSTTKNFIKARMAIQSIPDKHREKRRADFRGYWNSKKP
jgi:hypothetical protein